MKFSVLALAATAAALPAFEMARASNTTLESLDKRVSKLEKGMKENSNVLVALRDAVAQLGSSQPAANAKMAIHHGKHHPAAAATSTGATETATPVAGAGVASNNVARNETAGKFAMHHGHGKGHGKGNGYESPPILPESLASGDAASSPTPVAAAEDFEMKHGKHHLHEGNPLESGDAAASPTPAAAAEDWEMKHGKHHVHQVDPLESGDAAASPTPVAAAENWEMKHGKHHVHQIDPLESGDAATSPTPVANTGAAASDVFPVDNDMEMMHNKRQASASPTPVASQPTQATPVASASPVPSDFGATPEDPHPLSDLDFDDSVAVAPKAARKVPSKIGTPATKPKGGKVPTKIGTPKAAAPKAAAAGNKARFEAAKKPKNHGKGKDHGKGKGHGAHTPAATPAATPSS